MASLKRTVSRGTRMAERTCFRWSCQEDQHHVSMGGKEDDPRGYHDRDRGCVQMDEDRGCTGSTGVFPEDHILPLPHMDGR